MRLSKYVPESIARRFNGWLIGLFVRIMNDPDDPWTVRHLGGYNLKYVGPESEDERALGRLEGLMSTAPTIYVFFPFFWFAVGVFVFDTTNPSFYIATAGVVVTSVLMIVAFHALGEVRVRETHG